MSTPIIALKPPTEPLPDLSLTHSPGFVRALDEAQGSLILFESAQSDFALSFTCSMTWFTEGEHETRLSFYMEPDAAYWQFEGPSEPWRLAGQSTMLAVWLRDVTRVIDWVVRAYPNVRIEGETL
ncbi:hypothetical protein [Bifidobacterium avesanii]|uniref:Uncharacterized protein n=1 Tax=Bifidobacterium avesanii TaxID=1798157 RepID=A0A7K3TG21_9BIFI|nr:hypothetical protein [Bifidobacterium avesanii]KAB8294526.1 hypothetical protein DSM100685_0319 [Bifidobacterium avesanii]NEG78041.1 hypothetical protein [Bifidobacterium avesanii]